MLVCLNIFGTFSSDAWLLEHTWWFYVLAGLVFSLINAMLRPLVMLLALPLLRLSLGAVTILVNVLMMALTVWVLPGVTMSFWGALLSCITISIANYLVNLATSNVK
jgi:putative membrane protein